jgi:AraC family transcriptional activator of pobA
MTERNVTGNLFDPRNGDQAIRTQSLRLDRKPTEPARTNYFSIYFIEAGSGTFWADASQFTFGPDSLLFFVPYQHIRFAPDAPVHGEVVQFHANFLCVETFHAEVGCSGLLFNDPYGIPVVVMDGQAKSDVKNLIDRIRTNSTSAACSRRRPATRPRSSGSSRRKSEAGAICPCFRPMRPFCVLPQLPILETWR